MNSKALVIPGVLMIDIYIFLQGVFPSNSMVCPCEGPGWGTLHLALASQEH